MAFKNALIAFRLEELDGLRYDPNKDYKFDSPNAKSLPVPGEAVQPIVAEAFVLIRECLVETINPMFRFGSTQIQNFSNYLHIATTVINLDQPLVDGTQSQTFTTLTVKFYRLDPTPVFKVSLDLEQMATSAIEAHEQHAFEAGISNKELGKFVALLDDAFKLGGKFEHIPVLKRGNVELPRYLVSSDERVLEYDFDELLYHKRSKFQDVKIVSSPSLGNTLLLDNLQNLAEVDLDYTYTLMNRGVVDYKGKEILILGGGDGGLLWELLKEEPKFVTLAEIDRVVIESCRDHLKPCGESLSEPLEGPNYKIELGDCKKILRQAITEGKQYDVIFNDLTDVPVSERPEALTAFEPSVKQRDNPWHFIEAIFNLSFECLAEDGLYMSHATGKGNLNAIEAYERFLGDSAKPVEWERRESYVPSFMEIWTFYTIRKKKLLPTDAQQLPQRY